MSTITGMTIRSVWLRKEGVPPGPEYAVVIVEDENGVSHELIRENIEGPFSHCANLPSALSPSRFVQQETS